MTGLAALCAISTNAAFAQPAPAQPPPTAAPPNYKSLLDQGFEIKNVLHLPDSVSTRLAQIIQPDTVLITLEKGPVSATCWVTLSAWQQQTVSAINCNVLQ
ncbi:MAG TPA: hypothetical protein VKS78_09905 [Roseiarcus sp.]|nr:hypothetical protein [Roseiarcus sp.]